MRQFAFARVEVAQEVLGGALGAAVDAQRLERRVLVDRQASGCP